MSNLIAKRIGTVGSNINRLVIVLRPFRPRRNVRGEARGEPIVFDGKTIARGGSVTLPTIAGDVDSLQQPLFGSELARLALGALLRAKGRR